MQQFKYPDNFIGDLMRSSDAQDNRISNAFDSYGLVGAAGQIGKEAFNYPAQVAKGAVKNHFNTMMDAGNKVGQVFLGKEFFPDPQPGQGLQSVQQPSMSPVPTKQFTKNQAKKLLQSKALQKKKPHIQVPSQTNIGLTQPVNTQPPIDAGLRAIMLDLMQDTPTAPKPTPQYNPRPNIMNMETGIDASVLPGGAFGGLAGLNMAIGAMLPERAQRIAEENVYKKQMDERAFQQVQFDKERQYRLGLATLLGNLETSRQEMLNPETTPPYMPVTLTDTAIDGTRTQRIVPFDKMKGEVVKTPEQKDLERKIKIAQNVLANPEAHPDERVLKARAWLSNLMKKQA